jgi:hypothetical protein
MLDDVAEWPRLAALGCCCGMWPITRASWEFRRSIVLMWLSYEGIDSRGEDWLLVIDHLLRCAVGPDDIERHPRNTSVVVEPKSARSAWS